MIRRMLVASAAVFAFALAAPINTQAQSIFVLAGVSAPTGGFADYAKTGWLAAAGVTFPVGEDGLWAGVEGMYGINNHDVDAPAEFFVEDGDKTNLLGAMAILGYDIATEGNVNPYVWGGAGIQVHRFVPETGDSESESEFGYQFGAGVGFGSDDSSARPFVEVRYQGAKESKIIAGEVGVSFSVGN